MSNIEHLFENAICAHLRGETYEDFCKYPGNQMMIADEETDPEVIWLLAQYTASTYEVPRWIPVTERLPEHNKKVLCIGIDGSCSVMLYNHFESGWKTGIFSTNLYCRGLITHWRPLPEPPEVE